MTDRFLVVVNPRAGGGRAGRTLPAIEHALGRKKARFDIALTRHPGDATARTREALQSGVSGVAVVGGDGTLNEVLNGFFDANRGPIAPGAWLGPLPCGTGGDLRRSLEIPHGTEPMVAHLIEAPIRRVDVGWVRFCGADDRPTDRAFINIASFGLTAHAVHAAGLAPRWMGGGRYAVGAISAALRYRRPEVRVTLNDGAPSVRNPLALVVANGQFFGGGMRIAPQARLDDGQFDVVRLDLGLKELIRIGPRLAHVYRGDHLGEPGVVSDRAVRVRAEPVHSYARVLIEMDGETPGALPATFEIAPGALPLRG